MKEEGTKDLHECFTELLLGTSLNLRILRKLGASPSLIDVADVLGMVAGLGGDDIRQVARFIRANSLCRNPRQP